MFILNAKFAGIHPRGFFRDTRWIIAIKIPTR